MTASITAKPDPRHLGEELTRLQRQYVNAAERAEKLAWAFCDKGDEWRAGVLVMQASNLRHQAGIVDAILTNLDNETSKEVLHDIQRAKNERAATGKQVRFL